MFRLMEVGVVFAFIGLVLLKTSRSANQPDKDVDKSKQLTVEVLNSTSITLRWAQPRVPDRACPVERYMIRLRQDGQKQARTWRFDGARLSVTLHDLRPATVYHVRLLSVACDNKKKSSRWIRITTTDQTTYSGHQRHAPGQPTSVRTITLTDSVIVTWLPPEDDVFVRGYIIGYGEGVPDVNWRYVNGSQRNVTLKNLKPLTQYVISVRAFNDAGKGQVVYDIVYTKEASAAVATGSLPAPTHLRSRMISSSTALLQWTDPSLEASQRITDERYYNVYYQALPSGKNLSMIVKALQVTLYDLLPNKNYRFSVRTVKGSATSPFSDSVSSRTPGHSGPVTPDSKGPRITPVDARNKTVATPDEDYDYEIEETTGYDAFVVQPGAGIDKQTDFKTKRANTIVHESLARTLTSANTSSPTTTQNDVKVSFRFMVQYRISAYVTWPERLSPCAPSDETKMAGYLFRYKTIDDAGEYVTRNLATNFILLENLVPNTSYKYQVKYVMDRGNTSAWSQEASLDTRYRPIL